MSQRAGILVQQQSGPDGYSAFIPASLPPDPPLRLEGDLADLMQDAAYALGKLDGAAAQIDPDRLIYMYVRKEAVLSSQIEGTQSTLSELLEYEDAAVPGTPLEDVREVSRYVDALLHAVEQITMGALPLSLRLILQTHERLMATGRGSRQTPGEFRRTQNWIGGTRPGNATFVPPPVHEMMLALDNLEKFLHDQYGRTSPLVKAGFVHAQFETIHPFLDGNGRIGRLLISLILINEGVMSHPFFYISLYFMENRGDYYDALQRVRTDGDWEGWMRFFLIGVEAVAKQASRTAVALSDLFARDRRAVGAARAAKSTLTVYDVLCQRILVSAKRVVDETGLTWPTVNSALHRLIGLGVAEEVTGRRRSRLYVYRDQLRLLEEGTATKRSRPPPLR